MVIWCGCICKLVHLITHKGFFGDLCNVPASLLEQLQKKKKRSLNYSEFFLLINVIKCCKKWVHITESYEIKLNKHVLVQGRFWSTEHVKEEQCLNKGFCKRNQVWRYIKSNRNSNVKWSLGIIRPLSFHFVMSNLSNYQNTKQASQSLQKILKERVSSHYIKMLHAEVKCMVVVHTGATLSAINSFSLFQSPYLQNMDLWKFIIKSILAFFTDINHTFSLFLLNICSVHLNFAIFPWICDVFISCLDYHSDGTHSLQRIHCWASDVMLNLSKSVNQTHLHLEWIMKC